MGRTKKCYSWAAIAIVIGSLTLCFQANAQTPLTNDAIVNMIKAGVSEDVIVKVIASQDGHFSTTPDALIRLKQQGVSDKIVAAIVGKSDPANAVKASGGPAVPGTTPSPSDIPDEVGIFVRVGDHLVPLDPEIMTAKSSNIFGIYIGKLKYMATISGATSKRLLKGPVEVVIRTPEGTAASEYELLRLDQKENARQFEVGTQGLTSGPRVTTEKSQIQTTFEKIGKSAYKTILSSITPGEYGFMPPGQISTTSVTGKLYTFTVTD